MANVIVFDVNGTLLDISVLDPHFARIFSHTYVREEWFAILERLWLTDIVTNAYTEFSKLARAALQMTAEKWGVSLPADEEGAILGLMKKLPPYPDSAEGLKQLREAGFRLAALTNGGLSSAHLLLKQAGLSDYFEGIFSVEQVKRYKPAYEPYALVAREMHVSTPDLMMVAAHDWDIAGAKAAGLSAAFITRPGKTPNPAALRPDIVAKDIAEFARVCIGQYAPGRAGQA